MGGSPGGLDRSRASGQRLDLQMSREYRDHHSLPAGKQVLGGSESTDIIYAVNPNLSAAGMMTADSGPAFPSHLLVE